MLFSPNYYITDNYSQSISTQGISGIPAYPLPAVFRFYFLSAAPALETDWEIGSAAWIREGDLPWDLLTTTYANQPTGVNAKI